MINPTKLSIDESLLEDVPRDLQLDDFAFQQRHGKLDARRLYRVNVDQVIHDVDLETIHDFIDNIAFSQVTEMDIQNTPDVVILNAFQLSQLTIEYLANLQSSLYGVLDSQAARCVTLRQQLAKAVDAQHSVCDQLQHAQRDLRHKKKILETYEALISFKEGDAPPHLRPFLATIKASEKLHEAYTCPTCRKVFCSREYLWKHCKRRGHTFPAHLLDEEKQPASDSHSEVLVIRQLFDQAFERHKAHTEEQLKRVKAEERAAYEIKTQQLERDHEAAVESLKQEHREAMFDMKLSYEKRISQLEAKCDDLESKQQEEHQQETARLIRIIDELKLNLKLRSEQVERAVRDSSSRISELAASGRFQSSAPRAELTMELDLAPQTTTVNAPVQGPSPEQESQPLKQEDTRTPSPRVSEDVVASENADTEELPAPPPPQHQNAVSNDDVDELVRQFVHCRDQGKITKEHLREMHAIDVRFQNDFVTNKFIPKRQVLKYIPDVTKPYLRARWQHSLHELQRKIAQIKRDLKDEVRQYGYKPQRKRLPNSAFEAMCDTLDAERTEQPALQQQASMAAASLVDELSKVYYRPERQEHVEREYEVLEDSSGQSEASYSETSSEDSSARGDVEKRNLESSDDLSFNLSQPSEDGDQDSSTSPTLVPPHVTSPLDEPTEQFDSDEMSSPYRSTEYFQDMDQLKQDIAAAEDDIRQIEQQRDERNSEIAQLHHGTDDVVDETRQAEKDKQRAFAQSMVEKDKEIARLKLELEQKRRQVRTEKEKLQREVRRQSDNLVKAEAAKTKRREKELKFAKKREALRSAQRKAKEDQIELLRQQHGEIDQGVVGESSPKEVSKLPPGTLLKHPSDSELVNEAEEADAEERAAKRVEEVMGDADDENVGDVDDESVGDVDDENVGDVDDESVGDVDEGMVDVVGDVNVSDGEETVTDDDDGVAPPTPNLETASGSSVSQKSDSKPQVQHSTTTDDALERHPEDGGPESYPSAEGEEGHSMSDEVETFQEAQDTGEYDQYGNPIQHDDVSEGQGSQREDTPQGATYDMSAGEHPDDVQEEADLVKETQVEATDEVPMEAAQGTDLNDEPANGQTRWTNDDNGSVVTAVRQVSATEWEAMEWDQVTEL